MTMKQDDQDLSPIISFKVSDSHYWYLMKKINLRLIVDYMQ